MKICQLILAALLVTGFIRGLYADFNGTKAKEAGGFVGAIGTLTIAVILAWVYYTAGAFSLIW